MALGRKKPTMSKKLQLWMDGHNALACTGIGALSAAAIIGLFLFVAFSGFGASADFIYNQF
ncbi:MAG: hypothetical protein E7000_04630 [Coriobacteriaceae bacterium]|nr:hypothetical protein [Coriobacteriaceae bacterium]